MIIGLNGWVNAGKVSTQSVKYLIDKLNAEQLGEIASERFYIYQLQRPLVVIKNGFVQKYQPPRNDLFYWKDREESGLVFLLGVEPHLDWPRYSRTVLDAAKNLGVRRIYTIGGYVIDASLSGEPFVTGSSTESEILAELKEVGVRLVDYAGPTSVYSEILWESRSRDVDVASLWCAVPFYGQESDPKAVYTLLLKLTEIIGLKLDLEDLKEKAASFGARVYGGTEERMRHLLGDLDKSQTRKRPPYFI